MSAIGGIMELKRYGTDAGKLNTMRRSMCLRGGSDSAAYIGEGIGMLYSGEYVSDRQPNVYERAGRTVALCIDSRELFSSFALEKYLIYGVEFLEHISGSFSLALYDSDRKFLLLARDKKGKKPLFYATVGNTVYFASEIKAILDAHGGYAQIDREILAMHLTSPIGIYSPAQIYSDICEVNAGECVIFTGMGMSRFFYRDGNNCCGEKSEKSEILSIYTSCDTDKAYEYINEALIVFDYPQFDCFMPSLIEALRMASQRKLDRLFFFDAIKRRNFTYANMREDRLGALYGVDCVGVLPELGSPKSAPDRALENVLRERLFGTRGERLIFLRRVFGDKRFSKIMRELETPSEKEEDTEYAIRILAMLCQSIEWSEASRLLLK